MKRGKNGKFVRTQTYMYEVKATKFFRSKIFKFFTKKSAKNTALKLMDVGFKVSLKKIN